MINRTFAEQFAHAWVEAWNSHDLSRVLAHYTEDFELSSPIVIQVSGEPTGRLKGKAAIAAYWEACLQQMPNLHFELINILVGINTITLYYQGVHSLVAEVFCFNAAGYAVTSLVCYA